MQPETVPPSLPAGRESILVHGRDRFVTLAVALALAHRAGSRVAWVDFAPPLNEAHAAARAWAEARAGPPVLERVDSEQLRPGEVGRAAVERLVLDLSAAELARVVEHLQLPPLFQRLTAEAAVGGRPGAVLLANVDVLRPELRARSIEEVRVHETLHREGLSLVATSGAGPTNTLDRPFDRVYRVEPVADPSGLGLGLTEERGGQEPADGRLVPLRRAWSQLGLDPELLPPAPP